MVTSSSALSILQLVPRAVGWTLLCRQGWVEFWDAAWVLRKSLHPMIQALWASVEGFASFNLCVRWRTEVAILAAQDPWREIAITL
ncbi:hypothetical protein ACQKWADRAFT_293125 [Trichoderma austrokoningii]